MRGSSAACALLALAAALLAISPPAWSQSMRPSGDARNTQSRDGALSRRLGLQLAVDWLGSSDPLVRIRGLERLGSLGTEPALGTLIASLERGGAAQTSEERLTATRALAPHARDDKVIQALVRVMTGVGAPSRHAQDPLAQQVRTTAALALSNAGTPAALEVLGKALRRDGEAAEIAAGALLAHPPADLAPLLSVRGVPTKTLAALLGRLGDQRAFYPLRDLVQRGSPRVRAAAALSLTELGALETVGLARHWLSKSQDRELLVAAARILSMARSPDAADAIIRLLGEQETRTAALELSLETPNPALFRPLTAAAESLSGNDLVLLFGAVARGGSAEAGPWLERALDKPPYASLAAHALSHTPHASAREALERALSKPSVARMAARAAVVRAFVLSDEVPGLTERLEKMLSSRDVKAVAVGAWGLSVLERDTAGELLQSPSQHVVRAAAQALTLHDHRSAATERLLKERDRGTRHALALCLSQAGAAEGLPDRVLERLIDEGGAGALLALKALSARADDTQIQRIVSALHGSNVAMRMHAALGLGENPNPSVVGILRGAYRFEHEPRIRAAIISALSRRREPSRLGVLKLAADYDPDREVQRAARIALSGRVLPAAPQGTAVAWILLAPTSGRSVGGREIMIETSTGLVLPAVTDPDGMAVLTGLPEGPIGVGLAASPESDNAGSSE